MFNIGNKVCQTFFFNSYFQLNEDDEGDLLWVKLIEVLQFQINTILKDLLIKV